MKIEYDPDKNQRNIKKRGISFDLAHYFEWQDAIVWRDNRQNYGEIRYCALGYIDKRIYHLVLTFRKNIVRVISLRKANQREVNRYAET